MNRALNLAGILVCLLPAMAGDYQIKTIKILPVDSYPAQMTLGGITVAVDPYETNEKSSTAFDVKDLNARGYFPLHVLIRNSSPGYVTVKTRNIQLRIASGTPLYTMPATLVVQDIFRAGLTAKLPKMKSHDQSVSTKSGSPLIDFTTKELTNRQIEPGLTSDGFLFFFTEEPKKQLFAGAKLIIPEISEDAVRKTIGPFEIPLDPGISVSKHK